MREKKNNFVRRVYAVQECDQLATSLRGSGKHVTHLSKKHGTVHMLEVARNRKKKQCERTPRLSLFQLLITALNEHSRVEYVRFAWTYSEHSHKVWVYYCFTIS
jgi:hypothetical protein